MADKCFYLSRRLSTYTFLRIRWFFFIPSLLLLFAGCGAPIGTPCEIEGSGFGMRDNCAGRCMALRPITCPTGEVIRPAICSGEEHCVAGSCSNGQVCYRGSNDRAVCLPATLCQTWADKGVTKPVLESDEARKQQTQTQQKTPKPVTVVPANVPE